MELKEHLDAVRRRLRAEMASAGIDVLVSVGWENVYYTTGFEPFFSSSTGVGNLTAVSVLARDEAAQPYLLLIDLETTGLSGELYGCELVPLPSWTFIAGGDGGTGPDAPTPSSDAAVCALAAVLHERLLLPGDAAVGLDLAGTPGHVERAVAAGLAGHPLVDSTDVLLAARATKTPWEVDRLRNAVQISEAAVASAVAGFGPATSARVLAAEVRRHMTNDPRCTGVRMAVANVGTDFSPRTLPAATLPEPAMVVRLDVGAEVDGYLADIARTYYVDVCPAEVRRIHAALLRGFHAVLDAVRPGQPMGDAFERGMAAVHDAGLPQYRRGHLGHSVGLSRSIEEAPFIAPGVAQPFTPGMVLCVETPYYDSAFGAVNIEDMILVTDTGYESLSALDHALAPVGR